MREITLIKETARNEASIATQIGLQTKNDDLITGDNFRFQSRVSTLFGTSWLYQKDFGNVC